MRPLSHNELLNFWEWGTHRSGIERGLMLISLSSSYSDRDKLLGLSIGERDGRLIRLRQMLLGDMLMNVANCPTCNEIVEWEMNINHFQIPDFPTEIKEQTYELEIDDFSIQYRLPNTKDLLTAIHENQESEEILKNCVLVAMNRDNQTINYSELPDTIWDNLSKQMDQQDPLANIQFSLTCPSCQHHWQSTFDIMSYLWTEIDSWARRMLQEVCILARAYHWSEKEILGMSAKRRQMYLELIS